MIAEGSSKRQELLEVAGALFYQEGIRAIGVDTIVEQSGVGKATLYRHFPTKDDLIVAYLEEEDRQQWQWFEEVIAEHEGEPVEQLLAWFEACTRRLTQPGFRGCAFLNALAEFSEADHPVHRCAIAHERALRDRLAHLSRQAGVRDVEHLAAQLRLESKGGLARASSLCFSGLEIQVNPISAHRIELQLERTQAKP